MVNAALVAFGILISLIGIVALVEYVRLDNENLIDDMRDCPSNNIFEDPRLTPGMARRVNRIYNAGEVTEWIPIQGNVTLFVNSNCGAFSACFRSSEEMIRSHDCRHFNATSEPILQSWTEVRVSPNGIQLRADEDNVIFWIVSYDTRS